MQQNIQTVFEANKSAIKEHLDFLFGDLKDHSDGYIEIAYTLPNSREVTQCEKFLQGEIHKAVDRAIQINSVPGQNTYVAASLLDPETPPFGRSKDDDAYITPCAWVDIDDEVQPETLKSIYKDLPPSLVVVTGRYPHIRTQLWFKYYEPETDHDIIRETNTGLVDNFKGDNKVVNPARLMRLGGTIAWPKKDGRKPEITEVKQISSSKAVMPETLMAKYPANDYEPDHADMPKSTSTTTTAGGLSTKIIDGRESYMNGMVFASIINLTGESGAWPTVDQVFDNVWPVYESKVSPRAGRTLDQDGRGAKAVRRKIQSKLRLFTTGKMRNARSVADIVASMPKKVASLNQATFNPETGETEKARPIKATSVNDIDFATIPPREFLYHNIVARKYVTMIVAPPGAGKSIFTLCMAISAATGKAWGTWTTPQSAPINVWVYNNEEGFDELRRRIKAIMIDTGIEKKDMGARLYVDSGEHRAIEVAKLDKDDSVIYTPDYEALKQEVIDRKIDLLIIDPFAETYNIRENDNDQIKNVTRLYRQIAVDCNCAVLLVHHTRKGMEANGGQAGNIDMARGGGSQIGVVRRAFTLTHMDEVEAKKLGVPKEHKKWFIRLDDAKTNITAPADKISWLKLKSVNINNGAGLFPDGDSVGVLIHTTPDEILSDFAGQLESEYETIFEEIVRYMEDCRLYEASVSQVVKSLIRTEKFNYKERKLRDKITEAIEFFPKTKGVMVDGSTNYLSISEKKGKDNSTIIKRHKDENNDY